VVDPTTGTLRIYEHQDGTTSASLEVSAQHLKQLKVSGNGAPHCAPGGDDGEIPF
jgi:hypothetical protein